MKSCLLFILIQLLLLTSCNKDGTVDTSNVNCDRLNVGIANMDGETVDTEIAKLLKDLNSAPNDSDKIGHEKNFEILIDRINLCEEISAEMFCYACIKTLPAISEILITADSAGVSVSRIIDMITPEGKILNFAGIHHVY